MNKIKCIVENCSHNKSGVCFANRVDIGGISAIKDCDTCCGAFLDKKNYSSLTNNTHGENQCDCLLCKVETCKHYENNLCLLEEINVGNNSANTYTETKCKSFEYKN